MSKAKHANWYLEVKINDEMAIRYYYLFRNKPHLSGKWVIRFLTKKGKLDYKVIDEMIAMLILKSHGKSMKDAKEVISKAIKGGEEIRKISFNPNTMEVIRVDFCERDKIKDKEFVKDDEIDGFVVEFLKTFVKTKPKLKGKK